MSMQAQTYASDKSVNSLAATAPRTLKVLLVAGRTPPTMPVDRHGDIRVRGVVVVQEHKPGAITPLSTKATWGAVDRVVAPEVLLILRPRRGYKD